MGTKMETNYDGELEEESGWTYYFETLDYSNVSLFSESSDCSNRILNVMQKDNIGEDNYRLTTTTTCNSDIDDDEHKIVGQCKCNGTVEEGGNSIEATRRAADFAELNEELESSSSSNCVRASSTTLSDASSFSSFSPIVISKKTYRRFCPYKLHQSSHPAKLSKESNHDINQHRKIRHAAAAAAANYPPELHLEDTATSSPSSALLHTTLEHSASSSSTTFKIINAVNYARQDIFYEEGTDAVSTRFKALEALIPRLREVAGKGKEEEMVKVIEGHVRDLELKVELLSSAWQLSQLKHQ